jgi:hypothetical protein
MKVGKSQGPKNERAKLNENLKTNGREPTETAGSDNCGHFPGLANQRPDGEAMVSGGSGAASRRTFAGLTKESDARETDGKGSQPGERHDSVAGGETE